MEGSYFFLLLFLLLLWMRILKAVVSQIDMEKLVRLLPLHLTAVLLSSQRDEASLRYLLSGLRLLYSLCEISSRHPKLEQVSDLFGLYVLFKLYIPFVPCKCSNFERCQLMFPIVIQCTFSSSFWPFGLVAYVFSNYY